VLAIDAVDADDLHALVDGVVEQLRAEDLAHRADHLAVVVVLVEVVRRLPAEVAKTVLRRGCAMRLPVAKGSGLPGLKLRPTAHADASRLDSTS